LTYSFRSGNRGSLLHTRAIAEKHQDKPDRLAAFGSMYDKNLEQAVERGGASYPVLRKFRQVFDGQLNSVSKIGDWEKWYVSLFLFRFLSLPLLDLDVYLF
jgi:hypothetical protein